MPNVRFQDKVVLITGGSSGIGLATATLLASEGARVVIVGRDQRKLSAAATQVGSSCLGVAADISTLKGIDDVMRETRVAHGRIDVLFINAGISQTPSLIEIDEAAFNHIVDINLKGVFFTFTKSLPLLSSGSSVILTSSAAHDMGRLGDPLYSATKAAVRSLVRTFAVSEEATAKKIRVNALTPGCIDTPLTAAAVTNQDVTSYLESLIPLKRWGKAEEAARAVAFLASDDSSYMTGAEIAVDGGLAQV